MVAINGENEHLLKYTTLLIHEEQRFCIFIESYKLLLSFYVIMKKSFKHMSYLYTFDIKFEYSNSLVQFRAGTCFLQFGAGTCKQKYSELKFFFLVSMRYLNITVVLLLPCKLVSSDYVIIHMYFLGDCKVSKISMYEYLY